MIKTVRMIHLLMFFILILTGCSYNPLSGNNHTTGSPVGAVSGAAIGGVGVAVLGGSKPLIATGGVLGGIIGYYVTTQRYDAGGLIRGGGQVYTVGQYIGIDIPADNLFEPNSAELLPEAGPILDSTAEVLERYPNNNIIISGNTSGAGRSRWELALSEKRAERVSAYLWNAGINQFNERSIDTRKLTYVGYGNYFPIANNEYNCGIRANSRIQITSYPSCASLKIDDKHQIMHNVGGDDDATSTGDSCHPSGSCKS